MAEHDTPPPICDYEGSTYRTDFWEGRGREYEDLVERIALTRLLPPTGRRLLDIGAGFGRLASLYDGYEQVILLDYSRSQLEYARERWGDERFVYVAADLYTLPLTTNAMDTVVTVRVMHHLADVPRALAQIARVACPQGHLVLEFANKRHAKNIVRHLLRRGPNPYDLQPYEFADLHFDFHPTWMAARLAEAGWRIERRLAVSSLRWAVLKRTLPVEWLVKLDKALQAITAPLALAPSLFVRAQLGKTEGGGRASAAALFRCPTCGHEPLERQGDVLPCPQCEATWPVENGIHLFK